MTYKEKLEREKLKLWQAYFKGKNSRGLRKKLNFIYTSLEKISKGR